MEKLIKDPLSLIVIGVAGQGNVMTSFEKGFELVSRQPN